MSSSSESLAKSEREVVFQQDLCFAFRELFKEQRDFKGLRFEQAEMEAAAGEGRADIVLRLSGGKAFVVIETKRKEGKRVIARDIDPWNPKVIKQALGYAALLGAPYFATANRGYVAAFRFPEPGEPFEIPKHRVFATAIESVDTRASRDFVQHLVDYESAVTPADRAKVATALDWTFVLRLRSFVDWLYRQVETPVAKRYDGSPDFFDRIKRLEKERGARIGRQQLAREMVYVLANKILFYKALERQYRDLPRLSLDHARDADEVRELLSSAFKEATEVTDDFEAIFSTAVYDDLSFDENPAELLPLLDGLQGFVEDMETYRLEELESDVIGHVYERLLPEEERHELGQFYTPPAIAELIVKWAVRSGDDTVFDPAAGSGTFLVKAYERLKTLKQEETIRRTRRELHRSILTQLYSNDIDPFAGHLTAMNLALRDVKNPVTEVNIFERDFFHLLPATGPVSDSASSEGKVPLVDVVVGNPPYTRWLELADSTKKAVKKRLQATLKVFGLVAQVRGGVETAIYQHFVIYGASFLKNGGRLGMIVSNSWLQTDVGIHFGEFLLDHFKVRAVLDFGPRFFEIPLVATTVILLEREEVEERRSTNNTVFAFVDSKTSVDDLLGIVERPGDWTSRSQVHITNQSRLRGIGKWIGALFGFDRLDSKLQPKTIPAGELFTVTKGTIRYCAEQKRGLGANDFFYLTDEGVRMRGLADYVYPTAPSARALNNYTFSTTDWHALKKRGQAVYFFDCSEPRAELSKAALDYIRWGETDCRSRNRDKTICARAQACVERSRKKGYVGWYDAGGVIPARIASTYYGQYRRRFIHLTTRLALDHDFIIFRERKRLSPLQLKAALASLNSTLGQLYLESKGRTTGGGMVSLEGKYAEELRIVPVTHLPLGMVELLANSFDELEKASRAAGGANDRSAEAGLVKQYKTLDVAVAKAIGLSSRDLQEVSEVWTAMRERRLLRVAEPSPEAISGEESGREDLNPPKRRRPTAARGRPTRRLDEFD